MAVKHSLGWIGMGRMGYPMAERLLKAGYSVAIWNRTRAKAEPLAKKGGRVVDHPNQLAGEDIVFTMVSGPKPAFEQVQPYLATIAASGVAYVGEGELARICKIAHNVFLGVVIQNLAEITVLAQKAGVPRHAFLEFMNASVLGSTFTKYKSNALVNLDWTTTFTPALLRKDLDLGLKAGRDLDVAMPVTAAT